MKLNTVSPIDGSIVVERDYHTASETEIALASARRAQLEWSRVPIAERAAVCERFVQALVGRRDELASELTSMMGRPIRYTPGEINGTADRARAMIALASEALADVVPPPIEGFRRFVRRSPLGVVLVIAPWNYPYLTSINTVIPAIMAGNAVILKHSSQTPLVAERYAEAFAEAGLPQGVYQYLHVDNESTESLIRNPAIDFVAFTGSVGVGEIVERNAAGRFIGVGLELGGKDPAYVRADADLEHALDNIVDGVYFNSGQSCCGIERVYVHSDVFEQFIDGFARRAREYVLGDPRDAGTTLGPMIKPSAADAVRAQISEAIVRGARSIIDESLFPLSQPGTAYLAPQALIDVDHSMSLMTIENFGPVTGIMKVSSDDDAVMLMNDSQYGLTASIWTRDEAAAIELGMRVETGTCFMNRCDYLDPYLAWTGVKNSGRGVTLSRIGYEHLTRPKSFHLRR
ncbi:MAG: aldehyde dehydrogenase family protein [bacterium]|nr:aldehyde dehydrogenase family protein [Candidatus Kapabacteria bacterium]